jgi:hypothetical protein
MNKSNPTALCLLQLRGPSSVTNHFILRALRSPAASSHDRMVDAARITQFLENDLTNRIPSSRLGAVATGEGHSTALRWTRMPSWRKSQVCSSLILLDNGAPSSQVWQCSYEYCRNCSPFSRAIAAHVAHINSSILLQHCPACRAICRKSC